MSVVSVQVDMNRTTASFSVNGIEVHSQSLSDVVNWTAGEPLRLAVTMWNGIYRLWPCKPDRHHFILGTTLERVSEVPVAMHPCESRMHSHIRDRCRICTACQTCTGYGTGCCVSGPGGLPGQSGDTICVWVVSTERRRA